jgi:hypothetical protein
MSIVIASTPASPAASQAAAGDAARAAPTKTGASSGSGPAVAVKPVDSPGTTVTLSAQAMNALNRADSSTTTPATHAAAQPSDSSSSVYDSLKKGITTAVDDVGEAASDSVHWLANGVGSVFSAADTLAHGIVDLPFAAVGKVCDAAGAVLDAI